MTTEHPDRPIKRPGRGKSPGDGPNSFESILILAFFLLCLFPILYICRFLDHNTLLSWQWTFAEVPVGRGIILVAAALVVAALLAPHLRPESHPLALLFILSLAAVLPLWGEAECMVDSGRYFLQAKNLAQYGPGFFLRHWGGEIFAWTDLPLVPTMYGMLMRIFGESRLVLEGAGTVLFVLAVLLTRQLGCLLWDEERGFYGGMFLLAMPYLLVQVPQVMVDVPTMFFLVLALYLFLKAIGDGGGWLVCAPPALIALALTKYSAWPMLLLLPLAAWAAPVADRRRGMRRAILVLVAAAAIGALIMAAAYQLFKAQLAILVNYQRPALSLWGEGFVSNFLFQIHPLITIFAVWGAVRAWRARDRRFMIPFFVVIFIVMLRVERIRYLLPLLPFFALMAAGGLVAIPWRECRAFAALAAVFTALLVLYGAFLPFLKTTSMMNLKAAGEFLDRSGAGLVEVRALPQLASSGNSVAAIAQLDIFTRARFVCVDKWQKDVRPMPPLAPLLFTTKLRRPRFYLPAGPEEAPLLVLIGPVPLKPPPERRLLKRFAADSGTFRFTTAVSIYR